jgi:hypothetical protein
MDIGLGCRGRGDGCPHHQMTVIIRVLPNRSIRRALQTLVTSMLLETKLKSLCIL